MTTKGFTIRIEEYVALADIILFNYSRDLPTIVARYPKLKEAYKASFTAKLETIKTQEKKLVLTKQKTAITKKPL
jgi:intein/homing endonuclease